jgi:superfamily II DNA or RNA helicase
VQREALTALEQTRLQGFRRGLVVMATGLGKTWLAAFDTARPQFRRVLFVAHREEILRQSLEVFRRAQLKRFVCMPASVEGPATRAGRRSFTGTAPSFDGQGVT